MTNTFENESAFYAKPQRSSWQIEMRFTFSCVATKRTGKIQPKTKAEFKRSEMRRFYFKHDNTIDNI